MACLRNMMYHWSIVCMMYLYIYIMYMYEIWCIDNRSYFKQGTWYCSCCAVVPTTQPIRELQPPKSSSDGAKLGKKTYRIMWCMGQLSDLIGTTIVGNDNLFAKHFKQTTVCSPEPTHAPLRRPVTRRTALGRQRGVVSRTSKYGA